MRCAKNDFARIALHMPAAESGNLEYWEEPDFRFLTYRELSSQMGLKTTTNELQSMKTGRVFHSARPQP
jgi:hypothetical protein